MLLVQQQQQQQAVNVIARLVAGIVVVVALQVAAPNARAQAQVVGIKHPESGGRGPLLHLPHLSRLRHQGSHQHQHGHGRPQQPYGPGGEPNQGLLPLALPDGAIISQVQVNQANQVNQVSQLPPANQPDGLEQAAKVGGKHSAMPGNVIVHFDREHEIQQMQYVMRDGRLVELFRRPHVQQQRLPSHVHHPLALGSRARAVSPQDLATAAGAPGDVGSSPLTAATAATTGALGGDTVPAPASGGAGSSVGGDFASGIDESPIVDRDVDHDETIDILNDKLEGVSQLIGNHLTIRIPADQLAASEKPARPAKVGASATDLQQRVPVNALHVLTSGDHNEEQKMDVLATIAVDALQAGAHVGHRKLKKISALMMEKMKRKVKEKLHEMPELVEEKLRHKSAALSRVYQDQSGHQVVLLEAPLMADQGHKHRLYHKVQHQQQASWPSAQVQAQGLAQVGQPVQQQQPQLQHRRVSAPAQGEQPRPPGEPAGAAPNHNNNNNNNSDDDDDDDEEESSEEAPAAPARRASAS